MDYKEIMTNEINRRTNNSNFESSITEKVFQRNKRDKKVKLYSFSISGFAFAAAIALVLNFSLKTENSLYYNFISQQTNGTYSAVFSSNNNDKSNNKNESDIFSSDIDDFVSTTLAQR